MGRSTPRTPRIRSTPLAAIVRPDLRSGWIGPRIDTAALPLQVGRALHRQITTHFQLAPGIVDVTAAREYYTETHTLGFGNIAADAAHPKDNYCYCHDAAEDSGPDRVTAANAPGRVDWAYLIADDGLHVLRVTDCGISDPVPVPWTQPDDPIHWQVVTGGLDHWTPRAGQAPTGAAR